VSESATGSLPAIEEIEEAFTLLEDWDERFAYLLDLARKRPPFPPEAKIDPNRVHGCQSTVHLQVDVAEDGGGEPRLRVRAESDAAMVNGLIAVMMALYDGRTPAEARAIDPQGVVSRLGLDEHLSPTRKNGLHALIEKIQTLTRHV
jgi:cysteine desulfuration protein SufE